MNLNTHHIVTSLETQSTSEAVKPLLKRQMCKARRLEARNSRAYATSPLTGKYAVKGQFGALALRKDNAVFAEIPYILMKSSKHFGTLERCLRNAYELMGSPLYGVHICSSRGRTIVEKTQNDQSHLTFYRWRSTPKNEQITPLIPANRHITLAIAEACHGIRVKILAFAVGFCMPSEKQVVGMVPHDFILQSENSPLCTNLLHNAYACLKEWGELRYGWIVSYIDDLSSEPHLAFVAIEHNLESPESNLVVYRSKANMNERFLAKCQRLVDEKNRRYEKKLPPYILKRGV